MEKVGARTHTPQQLIEGLSRQLEAPLPGLSAQRRMAPYPRRLQPEPGTQPRHSAVLIPLYPAEGHIHVIFTVRAATLNHHSSEISFPGGTREASDPTLENTALREVAEEIALPPAHVTLLGALTPLYIPPSHNLVQPFVGWIAAPPPLHANPAEVAAILQLPLARFLEPEAVQHRTWLWKGERLQVPCYQIDTHCIWGATAMIFSELLTLISRNGTESA